MRLKEIITHLWDSHRGALVLLAVLLVINVLLYSVIEQFMVPRVMEKESRFLKRQAEVRNILHNQASAASSPEQLYVVGSQDLSKFHQSIPPYQEFTALIEELLVLSNDAGLNIAQISYSSEMMKDSPLLKLDLNFSVSGDYADIKKFIYSLEQSIRLLAIKQINLQSKSSEAVNLRLALETYFQPGGQQT